MHYSSTNDSGSLLKPLELGNLGIFLYFLVPKKPRLFALGNLLSRSFMLDEYLSSNS